MKTATLSNGITCPKCDGLWPKGWFDELNSAIYCDCMKCKHKWTINLPPEKTPVQIFLRDDFAGRAMQGILGSGKDSYTDIAKNAYAMADAMLEARKSQQINQPQQVNLVYVDCCKTCGYPGECALSHPH